MSSLSVFVQDIARKLRFWSNTMLDFAAGERPAPDSDRPGRKSSGVPQHRLRTFTI
jgi:hypothetical protein